MRLLAPEFASFSPEFRLFSSKLRGFGSSMLAINGDVALFRGTSRELCMVLLCP